MVTTRNKAAVPATKPVEKPAKKITFDSDDEDEAVNEAIAAKSQRTEEDEEPTKPTEEDEESDSDSDDDDAPEAVTVSSGREAAKQKEEEARRAIEAQEELLRQKRKRRDAQLLEQKQNSRKRQRVTTADEDIDDATKGTEVAIHVEAESTTGVPNTKGMALLPTELLEQLEQEDEASESEDEEGSDEDEDEMMDDFSDDEMMGERIGGNKKGRHTRLDSPPPPAKRRVRKEQEVWNKGPVKVKVLKDVEKEKKVMAAPVAKQVYNRKMQLVKGRTERRKIGGGFVKRR